MNGRELGMRPGPVFGEPRSAGREGALEAIAAVRAGGQDRSCLKPLAFGSITRRAWGDAWHSDSVPAPRVAPWATFRKSVRAPGRPPQGQLSDQLGGNAVRPRPDLQVGANEGALFVVSGGGPQEIEVERAIVVVDCESVQATEIPSQVGGAAGISELDSQQLGGRKVVQINL